MHFSFFFSRFHQFKGFDVPSSLKHDVHLSPEFHQKRLTLFSAAKKQQTGEACSKFLAFFFDAQLLHRPSAEVGSAEANELAEFRWRKRLKVKRSKAEAVGRILELDCGEFWSFPNVCQCVRRICA